MRCFPTPGRVLQLIIVCLIVLLSVQAQDDGGGSSTTTTTTSTTTTSSTTTTTSSTTTTTTTSSTTTTTSSSTTSETTTSTSSTSSSTPLLPSSLSSSSTTSSSPSLIYSTVFSTSYQTTGTDTAILGGNTDVGNNESNSDSGNGFLQNKGAVAGVFTVVGVAGVAIIGGLIYYFVKRQERIRDEEDLDRYFEKPATGYQPHEGAAQFPGSGGGYTAPSNYYGGQHIQHYDDGYPMDYPPDTGSYADSRPPSAARGTAYAAALAHQGQPYQYSGYPQQAPQAAYGYDPRTRSPVYSGSQGHNMVEETPFADPRSTSTSPRPPANHDPYADPYYARE